MKSRPRGFIAEDKIDHNGEIFDYIRELHSYLWRFIRAVNPSASGLLSDYVDEVLDDIESKCRTMSKQKKIHIPVTGTDYPVRDRKALVNEQDELLLTEIKKVMDSLEPTHRLTCDDRDNIASQILAKVKQHYEVLEDIDEALKNRKRLDRPDSISSVDELEKFYSWYEKYLPDTVQKYPITMRVTKEEEEHILLHRGAMPLKKEVSNG